MHVEHQPCQIKGSTYGETVSGLYHFRLHVEETHDGVPSTYTKLGPHCTLWAIRCKVSLILILWNAAPGDCSQGQGVYLGRGRE